MARFPSALLAAAAAVTTLAPVAAQAAPPQIERSSEGAQGDHLRGGYWLPLAGLIAIVLGIVLLSGGNNNNPVSP